MKILNIGLRLGFNHLIKKKHWNLKLNILVDIKHVQKDECYFEIKNVSRVQWQHLCLFVGY